MLRRMVEEKIVKMKMRVTLKVVVNVGQTDK